MDRRRIMKLRNTLLTAAMAVVLSVTVTGCGIVTIVPKGEESKYTGEEVVSASQEADSDWDAVVDEVTENAQDLAETVESAETGESYAVKFTGTVEEYNTDTPKGYLAVTVDGISDPVQVATGKIISGTAVRDCQTVKEFEDFTNQTEWSEYARNLNDHVISDVITANNIGDDTVGKTISVVGCFTPATDGTVSVVPVSIEVQ
jgi:predicted lipoprotein